MEDFSCYYQPNGMILGGEVGSADTVRLGHFTRSWLSSRELSAEADLSWLLVYQVKTLVGRSRIGWAYSAAIDSAVSPSASIPSAYLSR